MKDVIEAVKKYTMLTSPGLAALSESVSAVTVPGAIVECGVASGGAAAFLWWAMGSNRHLWLFDSWQGLPRPDSAKDGGRSVSKHINRMQAHNGKWCFGAIEDVIRALQAVGVPLELTHFVPGWFHETLPERAGDIGPIAVLHLDGDFYESTVTALKYLWPHVVPGGVVVFDDYDAWPGCRLAVDEFCTANKLDLIDKSMIVKKG